MSINCKPTEIDFLRVYIFTNDNSAVGSYRTRNQALEPTTLFCSLDPNVGGKRSRRKQKKTWFHINYCTENFCMINPLSSLFSISSILLIKILANNIGFGAEKRDDRNGFVKKQNPE